MTIKLKGSTDGSVSLQAPADTSPTGTDITLTLPTTAGSANQFVKNSGTAGTLEYSSITEDSSDNIICTARVDATRFRCTDDGTASLPSINPGLDNDTGLFRPASNTIGFSTTGNERMRITSSGAVEIGGSDSAPVLRVGSTNNNPPINNIEGITLRNEGTILSNVASSGAVSVFRANANQTLIQFRRSSSVVGSISVTTTNTSYNTSSDHRLKENVVDLDGAIDRVKQLAPKRFNFIADAERTVDGFLAHEAQTVVPEAVTGTHNEVDDDGEPVMQGIDQSKLVPLLTAALQEAIAKIETLETKVAALEAGS